VVFLYKLNLFLNFSGDSFERTAWKFSKPSNEKLNLAPEVSPQPIFIIFSLLLLSLGKYLVVHYKRQDGCGAVFCSRQDLPNSWTEDAEKKNSGFCWTIHIVTGEVNHDLRLGKDTPIVLFSGTWHITVRSTSKRILGPFLVEFCLFCCTQTMPC